ncbi:MAG: hypothetical protein E6468_07825 [Varibaculum cambriense]|uniref:hypothetical protein n=1 Tax=Varibaculum cambriense TaxID=184870 RepID=UPI00290F4501|nr:hypothetical protein [Varibaculum cambriense]MDU6681739.1 hypothetical protein [Varibaculum cambriense]
MRLKLIDHESVTEETDFGTCDLCAYTGEATFTTLIFKRDDGEILRAETWYWCWGDLFEIDIDNVFDFAAWIKDKEFPEDLDITDYYTLEGIVEDYERYKHLKEVGVMHLKLIGHETTPEGTILIFEKDGETLRAKTWYWAETHRLEMHIENLSDFAAWVARQDFPADLDITDYHDLAEVVVDFEEDTYGD